MEAFYSLTYRYLQQACISDTIRYAYAASASPVRIYAQAISTWVVLHPAPPLSLFCRKCNINVPIGAGNFSLVYNTHLALGYHALADFYFAVLNFCPMHMARTGDQTSQLSGLRATATVKVALRKVIGSQQVDVDVGDAKVRRAICRPGIPRRERPDIHSTPLSTSLPLESADRLLSGGMVPLGAVHNISTQQFILDGLENSKWPSKQYPFHKLWLEILFPVCYVEDVVHLDVND